MGYTEGGSEILEKKYLEIFFGKSSYRYLSPSFDGERGGIWGANGEGGVYMVVW